MKRLSLSKKQSKRGMASFYVVIFATILFGVVTVSFVRIILSEATQSSNDDLSRSAYDSAIAGVEDAKTAVNRYYSCVNNSSSNPGDCTSEQREKLFRKDCSTDKGIGIASYLYGDNYNAGDQNNVEVKIQEENVGSGDNTSDQAYTCVIVNDTVPDYRGTLTDDTPTKAVPISIFSETGASSGTQINEVDQIRFSWYSQLNEGDSRVNAFRLTDGSTLNEKEHAPIPPAIVLTFIKVSRGMTTSEFHNLNNTDELVYTSLLLMPTDDNFLANSIDYNNLILRGNVNSATNGAYSPYHSPYPVNCYTDTEFACSITITGLKNKFATNDTVMLMVSLPYNDTVTDFSTTLLKDDGVTSIPFVGVQIQVDSTGRTNQLFRRVEARLDPIDLFFPFPQYELFLEGNESIKKDFWITANCWHNHPYDDGNRSATDNKPIVCPNNQKISP